eukprot:TRINITY_DN11964_c0_g1_i2.p1 TRINITY_DN11964_c0_g1~~TRINITY_DN11964_c0_g1_i2.p1  ORF type:complete len:308 (-),score=64.51 TRINITY_DN11964_c0_g1_i2:449-1372(-)
MLRCLAGICGNTGDDATEVTSETPLDQRQPVIKPVIRLDGSSNGIKAQSLQGFATATGYHLAPPGATEPIAVVSPNFQQNSSRLLLIVPAAGEPANMFDSSLGERGALAPMLSWAEANNYAIAIFSGEALKAAPADTWDRVLKGSPARYAAVTVAAGMFQSVAAALRSVHPLLFSRFRTVCVRGSDTAQISNLKDHKLPEELTHHLQTALAELPSVWEKLDTQLYCQRLFEFLQEREDRWQVFEGQKYAGFQTLEENDMPGLKRLGVDQRVQRMDRDRDNDELARLLKKHEKVGGLAVEEEEEPGLD